MTGGELRQPALVLSADGTLRCSACHLHDDLCTCRPEHPVWTVLRAALLDAGGVR